MSGLSPRTVIGIVVVIACSVALRYGHVELLEVQQSDGVFAVGNGTDETVRQCKLVRLGGVVGGVLTVAGAATD